MGAGYRPAVFTACYLPRYQSDVLEECCPFDDQAERGGHITQCASGLLRLAGQRVCRGTMEAEATCNAMGCPPFHAYSPLHAGWLS